MTQTVSHRKSFDDLRRLSAGTYATVYRKDKKNALKASCNLRISAGLSGDVENDVEVQNFGDTAKDVLKRSELIEAMILTRFFGKKHPNLLSAEEIFFDSFVGHKQFSLILQLQLASGSLDHMMRQNQLQFTAEKKCSLLKDITNGVAALHNLFGVCHGDLKPGNILIHIEKNGEWRAWIADFGLSTFPAFAVHGHAAECYTFGHVPPECCDRFHRKPFLIRDSIEANACLCSFSCFASPVKQTYDEKNANSMQTPDSSPSAAVSTPELILQRPRQANSEYFNHITKANLASDIWALGSIALFLSLGKNPIVEACVGITNRAGLSDVEEISFNFNHRAQMAMWFHALRAHQTSKEWEKVFDFDAVSRNFFSLYAQFTRSNIMPHLIDLDSLLCEKSSQEIDFIFSCLQFLPDQRASIDELCKHPFFLQKSETSAIEEKVGQKRRSDAQSNQQLKKKQEKKFSLLSVAITRSLEITQNVIAMPFHSSTMKLLVDICAHFRFSYKSLFLANAYIQFSASRILSEYDVSNLDWTEKNCKIHAVTCLLLAISLFEPRHDAIFDPMNVVEEFGSQHEFKMDDLATFQRLLIDCIQFEFDIPTVATFIDLSLSETKTTHKMPADTLVAKLITLLQSSESLFSCPQAISLALALLKKFDCIEAFEHLLRISGRRKTSINKMINLIK